MNERTQTYERQGSEQARSASNTRALALVVIWASEPGHVGETLLFSQPGAYVFGRGDEPGEPTRARLLRQRPGRNEPGTPVVSPFVSRRQLRIEAGATTLRVNNVGKTALLDDHGNPVRSLELVAGQTCEIEGQMSCMAVERPRVLPPFSSALKPPALDFGTADAFGFVGESEEAWRLREHCQFLAERSAPVLLLGPSGAGKEVAARAVHGASARGGRKLVTRNAATLPAGLAEAELFGNIANYPNPGMPERPGLVGEAQGGTLFLDELGELPEQVQARLLRLLDSQGDYQRLGDAKSRRAELRVIAATNRAVTELRTDLSARFKLRLTLPTLQERREDIPLIWRELARRIAGTDPKLARQFLDATGACRQTPELVRALVRHQFTTHVRELERILWVSIQSSRGDTLQLTPEVRAELLESPPSAAVGALPDAASVRAALERTGGVQERAWRELGLANRYVLKRLVKKYGISAEASSVEDTAEQD